MKNPTIEIELSNTDEYVATIEEAANARQNWEQEVTKQGELLL